MNTYEKSNVPTGSKMILKKTDSNLLSIMNSMNVPKVVQQNKKMRGPNDASKRRLYVLHYFFMSYIYNKY